MKLSDIKKIAHSILENQNVENSFIEYKKSTSFDYEGTKEGASMAVVWGGVAILMIPLAIITLPFQAVDSLSK